MQPAMRLLERWHVPRILAALLLILAVFGTIVGLGAAVAGLGPFRARLTARQWAEIPSRKGAPKLQIALLVHQPFHGRIF